VGLSVDVLLVDTDCVCVSVSVFEYIDVLDTKGLIVDETVDDWLSEYILVIVIWFVTVGMCVDVVTGVLVLTAEVETGDKDGVRLTIDVGVEL